MRWDLATSRNSLGNADRPLVYIAGASRVACETLSILVAIEGLRTACGHSEAALFETLNRTAVDIVILDESIGRNLGLGALAGLRRGYPRLPAIMTVSPIGLGISDEATALGAWELIVKPVDAERLLQAIHAALAWADEDPADEDLHWRHPHGR